MKYPKISVVVGSYNRLPMLKLCIEAIRVELVNADFEIIVVDGGSSDGAVEWLTKQKDIVTIIQHNRGEWNGKPLEKKPWAYFMNLAFKAACGKYICMLSDDSLIIPGAINNGTDLFDEMLQQNVNLGCVAFYFRDYPVRKDYAVAMNLGSLYVNHGLYLNDAIKEVGYIDETYHFYFADTDLVMKLKQAGYCCIDSKNSFVEHYFEATPEIRASNNDTKKEEDRQKLLDSWRGISYPENQFDNYKKHIGFWKHHPRGFVDHEHTIEKLINLYSNKCNPSLSIITVVYNDKVGLDKTIQSIRKITGVEFEFIVIDGCSTDGTLNVIKNNMSLISHWVSEPDEGIYDAMNKGIELASGAYINFMNAGDLVSSSKCFNEALKSVECATDVDVIYGDRNYVELNGDIKLENSLEIDTVHLKMPYCHQSALYKTSSLKKFPFNTTYKYSADYNQIVEMYLAKQVFKKVNIVICDYLAGGKSESGLRPYLEVLKIQFDNFQKDKVKESTYLKGLIRNFEKLILGYR
jgi:glycosyltransferase involved in cell wall biosynthesis